MATITATGTANWNTNGAWVGSVQPTAADDVVIPTGATITIPTATTALGRSVSLTGTGTVAFASTTAILAIGDGTAGAGNVALSVASTATVTLTGIGTIQFLSTSATKQTVATGGKTLPNVTFGGTGGSWVQSDALASSGTWTLTAGTVSTGAQSLTIAGALNTSSATAKTFNCSGSTVTITGSNTPIGCSGTNQTLTTDTTSVLSVQPSANPGNFGVWTGNWNDITSQASPSLNFQLSNGAGNTITCRNLTMTFGAAQTLSIILTSNVTCSGTLTITGNSAVNRPIAQSSVLGTARTFTAATVAISNTDFQDITGAGAAAPFAIASGVVGDRQGNTGITVTTPATQTRDSTGAAAWSVAARWTSRVPLPQDDVVFNSSSGSISATDVQCLGKSITTTGYTAAWTRTATGTAYTIFGNVTLGSGMGWGATPASAVLELRGRGSQTITSNGLSFFPASGTQALSLQAPGGTYTTQDAFTYRCSVDSVAATLTVTAGTWAFGNGFTHTIGALISSLNSYTRSVDCGTSTIQFYSTAGTAPINYSMTLNTFVGSAATFSLITATGNPRTFTLPTTTNAGGWAMGTFNYTVADSPGPITFNNGAQIQTINLGAGRQLFQTSATTLRCQTFNATGVNNGYQNMLNVVQDASNLISAPDSATTGIRVTGDITLDFKVQLASYSSVSQHAWVSKITSALTAGYCMRLGTTGILTLFGAGSQISASASLSTVFNANDVAYVRCTRRQSDGRVQFFTSSNGSSWTQLGTDVILASGTSLGATGATEPLYIGARQGANDLMVTGRMFYTKIYSDITQTTLVGNFDAGSKPFGADTFTDTPGNVFTIGSNLLGGDGRVGIRAVTAASAAILDLCFSAPTAIDYLVVKDIKASMPWRAYAGANSVNVSGNAGVHFAARTTEPYPRQMATAGTVSASNTFSQTATTGNLLIVSLAITGGSITNAVINQSGWTRVVHASASAYTWWKISDGTETQATFTLTGGAPSTQSSVFYEIVGMGAATQGSIGSNTGTGVTTLAALSGAGTSSASVPTWEYNVWVFSGAAGNSVSMTDGFDEGIAGPNGQISTVRSFGKPFLAGSQTINPTYTWVTSRNPASYMLEFVGSTSLGAALGRAIETDTARALGKLHSRAIGQVTTTETARALGKQHSRAIGRAASSGTARPLGKQHARALGRALETMTARALGHARGRSLGRALETDVSRTIGKRKQRAVGRATENDLAAVLARAKSRALGRATETDTARAVGRRKQLALGRALSTMGARVIVPSHIYAGGTILVGRALETDMARAITARLHIPGTIGHVLSTRIGHVNPHDPGHTSGVRPGHLEP